MGDPKRRDESELEEGERSSGVVARTGAHDIRLAIEHRSYSLATYGPITINLWDGAVREDRIQEVIAEAREQCQRYPAGGGFTILVERNTGLPPIEARGLVSSALHEMARYIQCAAVVLETEGFVAATGRSVINLLFLAARAPIQVRVCGSVEEAARWQVQRLRVSPEIEVPELARVYREVRRRHAELRRR